MKQLKLCNGDTYDLVVGGVFEFTESKIQLTILADDYSFESIESEFENELNTKEIKVIDRIGEITETKRDYTHLDSICKKNDYVTGSESYLNEAGETEYRDSIGTVYIITLSKPDIREQVKSLQETVDLLVLEGLEV